jgi:hypothetical protein
MKNTIYFDRLLVTEFLDAHHIMEQDGDNEVLTALLRAVAKKIRLDCALLPYWVEADNELKCRWMSARAWYLSDSRQSHRQRVGREET